MSHETSTAERLEQVRTTLGYEDLRSFWRDLTSEGFHISYDAARVYHDVDRQPPREPPAAYLARVAGMCSVRLEWLITGQGEARQHAEAEAKLAALEEFVAADYFAGIAAALGKSAACRVLRGTRRVLLAHTLTRFRTTPHNTPWLEARYSDARLGEAVGRALQAAFGVLKLDTADLPDDALTDYVAGVCSGLNHLTEITHVEEG